MNIGDRSLPSVLLLACQSSWRVFFCMLLYQAIGKDGFGDNKNKNKAWMKLLPSASHISGNCLLLFHQSLSRICTMSTNPPTYASDKLLSTTVKILNYNSMWNAENKLLIHICKCAVLNMYGVLNMYYQHYAISKHSNCILVQMQH